MNAAEIAETLINGNVAQAREYILWGNADGPGRSAPHPYEPASTALDVVSELAMLAPDYPDYQWALGKVRRCLEGGS